jgi:hypothetical protein
MSLYRQSRVSVESWVELARDVNVRYEVDTLNDEATLYFGNADYVLTLSRENLIQVLDLGSRAATELGASRGSDDPDDAADLVG